MSVSQSRIIQFFDGTGTDGSGRLLAEILQFDDARLEQVHDYIQWLFPLRDRSGANPFAPTLSEDDVAAFQARVELRVALCQGLLRMLRFYGLSFDGTAITPNADFAFRSDDWLYPGNHNHLRLTRIMLSLRTLGLERESQALFGCLARIYDDAALGGRDRITAETFRYWEAASQGRSRP
jgi:hypothetical protein